jgi:hypothetical protein
MDCVDCHGNLEQVSQNSQPWLNEPRCDNAACHGSDYQQDQALYRLSTEHGGIYCAACHDSPHAIAPSNQPNDAIKFVALQGHAGTLENCTVCHLTQPSGPGPHGATVSLPRMYVGDIRIVSRLLPDATYRLQSKVPVYDEQGNPLEGATVTAEWELPGGRTKGMDALTRRNGIASFALRARREGVYTLRVLNVQLAGYEYDPTLNIETSESLSVP